MRRHAGCATGLPATHDPPSPTLVGAFLASGKRQRQEADEGIFAFMRALPPPTLVEAFLALTTGGE